MPFDIAQITKDDIDKEILRAGIIAELDAINLYEQMAVAKDTYIRKTLLDVAKEEKIHVGEFQALLLERDKEQGPELKDGKKEIEELRKKKVDVR